MAARVVRDAGNPCEKPASRHEIGMGERNACIDAEKLCKKTASLTGKVRTSTKIVGDAGKWCEKPASLTEL